MPYLMRMNIRPDADTLKPHERTHLHRVFEPFAAEVRVHRDTVGWNEIDEVELVPAPSVAGVGGWIIDRLFKSEPQYHLGIYLGREEAVLANITMREALYVLHAIAYYAPQPVRYVGPDGLVPLSTV